MKCLNENCVIYFFTFIHAFYLTFLSRTSVQYLFPMNLKKILKSQKWCDSKIKKSYTFQIIVQIHFISLHWCNINNVELVNKSIFQNIDGGREKDLNIFEFFGAAGGNTRREVVNLLCKNPCEIFINGRSSGRGRKLIAFFVRCNTQHYYKFMT